MASTNPSSNEGPATIINFDVAMAHFTTMFPNISQHDIEDVLRKHNGDVSSTIDDLLQISNGALPGSSGGGSSSMQWQTAEPSNSVGGKEFCGLIAKREVVESPPMRNEENNIGEPHQGQSSGSSSSATRQPQSSTENDEKIALLIQNREFLNYLRGNPAFMREVYGSSYGRRHRRRYHEVAYPIILTSTPAFSSKHSRKFEKIEYGEVVRSDSPPPLVPDGPVVNLRDDGSIPDGPVVGFGDQNSSKWTKRLKSRIPFISKKESSFTHMPMTEDAESEPAEENENAEIDPKIFLNDQTFASRIQNLSRNSKSIIHTLAKKFSLSNGSARLSSKPIIYPDNC